MPRPREPFADAMRTAREIVGAEAGPLVAAASAPEPDAFAEACHALVLRIAQAITDATEAAETRGEREESQAA